MSSDPKLVTITIDGRPLEVPAGLGIVDAANRAGVEIPIFCHHPSLEPVGMCRMCLVEVGMPKVDRATGEVVRDEAGEPVIQFMPKLQAGCTTRAAAGMAVRTATPEVADARRSVLEFLLTSHPLDCPVCDKGGECPLQNLTMRYGPGQSRFTWGEKFHFEKPVPVGPLIVLDRERCVLCARCIRFQDEIAADGVLGFENRGRGMEIVSFSDPPFDSYFSGNTTDICPVGALTTRDFRFQARAWEVVGKPSVCAHCPVGCNTMIDTRFVGQVERVMPRRNDAVNEIWICDKGRFAHHFAAAPERLGMPLVRRDGRLVEASWDEALGEVADRLKAIRDAHGPGAIGGIAGDSVPNEDLYLFGRFLRAIIGTNHVDHRPGIVRDDILARAGAGAGTRLADLGAGTAVVVAGLDVEEEAPVLFLNLFKAIRSGAKVVVLGGRPQKLDPHAEAALRWRYGAEDSLLAALLRGVMEAKGATGGGGASEAEGSPGGGGASEWNSRLGAFGRASAYADGSDAGASGGSDVSVTEREDEKRAAAWSELWAAVADHTPDRLAGVHPVHAETLDAAVAAIAGAASVLVLYGREAAELGLVPALAALATVAGRPGAAGSGLVAVGPHANSQGAADMGLLPGWLPGYRSVADAAAREALGAVWPAPPPEAPGMDAAAMLAGGVRALYVVGTDPAGDDPRAAAALEGMDLVVVHELFLTETAKRAHVVLPAQSVPERPGTFTNMLRRVQRFYAAVKPVGRARMDWKILRDLGQRMGVPEPFASPDDVMDEIARAVPQYAGLTYDTLGASPPPAPTDMLLPFAPLTEARKVSYAGTAYENEYGEGLVWPVPEGGAAGLDWRPREPASPAGGDGALRLIPTRALYDAGTMLAPTNLLRPLIPPPHVVLSPFDAAARGIADGALVRLTTAHGSAETVARVRDGVTPGTVLAPEGLAWATPVRVLIGGVVGAEVSLEQVKGSHPVEKG